MKRTDLRPRTMMLPNARRNIWLLGAVLLLALGSPPGGARAAPDDAECRRQDFRVVIDVGHSAEVYGAISARGVTEYAFNLRLATRVETALSDAGFAQARLLISKGGPRSLAQRSVRADRLGADLFLSIHHDSVQDFYLHKWRYDGKERLFSDKFKGYSLFVSYENAQREASLRFATMLGDELKARGLTFTAHHAEDVKGERHELLDAERGVYRYDTLSVLRNTKAPAALLEAGVIVHREEELLLASPERQRLTAEAIVAAVDRFCVVRQAPHS